MKRGITLVKIRTWRNVAKEGFKNIYRNRVMSLASISAISAALFVLGLILALVFNVDNVVDSLESKVEITVYMKDKASYNDITSMENQIKSWDGIEKVEYTSKAQALEDWRREWGDMEYLLDGYTSENNPLPASFLIKVEHPEYVEDIVSRVNLFSQVEKIQYSKDVVDSINKIANAARLIGLALVFILIIMSVIIIYNTIKMTVFSRRREINIMKYIGATDWYIRWPFIIEGMLLGTLGAIIATLLTSGVYQLIIERLSGSSMQGGILSIFTLLPLKSIIYQLAALFLIVGCIIGVTSSMLSTYKHLNV